MAKGIDTTLDLLAKSKNRAALALLTQAFHSSDERMRFEAGMYLVHIRGTKGIGEIIRSFDPADKKLIDIIHAHREIVVAALRIALSGNDLDLARRALDMALSQHFFELLPMLLTAFLDQSAFATNDSTLETSILTLSEQFVQALEERKNRSFLYGKVMPETMEVLARGLNDFHRNDPQLFLVLFTYFYNYLSDVKPEVMRPFENPSSTAYFALFRLLMTSENERVIHFLFHSLDNPYPVAIVSNVFAKRSDTHFLNTVLTWLAQRVAPEMRANLRKISRIEWLDSYSELTGRLSSDAQVGLVAIIQALELSSEALQIKLQNLFQTACPEARCAVLRALIEFSGERRNGLVWNACGDPDPRVQVIALELLKKFMPEKAVSRMLQFTSSPHPAVREKIRALLPEFRFARFLETFDQMPDDHRQLMFRVVRELDKSVDAQLNDILEEHDPLMKARALLCIEYAQIVPNMEEAICGVLLHETHEKLRVRAALMLAGGRRDVSRSTLVQAMHRDASAEVRAAAKDSLTRRPAAWTSR